MAVIDQTIFDEITTQARQQSIGRTLLLWIATVLFGFGWLAAKIVIGSAFVAKWVFTAIRVGWRDGRKSMVAHQ